MFQKIIIKRLWVLIIPYLFSACSSNNNVKLTPEIVWDNQEDIKTGMPLSETQLNAVSDVPGSFTYNPPIGTILDEGNNQILSVEFTPNETSSYNIANSTVSINVIYNGISEAIFNPDLTYGTMFDIDGNSYRTITIGDQIWMAENLRTTKYRNGDNMPNINSNSEWVALTSGGYSNYDNETDLDKLATNGSLYNWFAVSDNRNIAPEGWHVATYDEWTELGGWVYCIRRKE